MTTEDNFQRQLTRSPHAWHTRLVMADWLQERGDPRAEGYRALGAIQRCPVRGPCWHRDYLRVVSRSFKNWVWVKESLAQSLATTFSFSASLILTAAMPDDWWQALVDAASDKRRALWNFRSGWASYTDTRRECEDAAAIVFTKLPPARRAELLAGKAVASE